MENMWKSNLKESSTLATLAILAGVSWTLDMLLKWAVKKHDKRKFEVSNSISSRIMVRFEDWGLGGRIDATASYDDITKAKH